MSFWKELSRRNVVKVGIAYAVAAWLIIHPVDIIFPILHLPEWSITLVAAFLIILFPLVLIFSWIYEVTPKGLKRTKEVPVSKSITHLTGKRLNYIITGLLVVAVAYLLFDKYYLNQHTIETKEAPVISEVVKTQKTIAVLPFTDLSPEKDQEYFVDGLSEEVINTLAQIPNLSVIGRTSSFSFKGSSKTTQEIASVLGVENILEGSVRKAGNELRITAQLLRGKDGFHLWSKTYDRNLKDIFAVQEDIAIAVADELKMTLGIGKSLKKLGGTENVEAYELYIIALGQDLDNLTSNDRALESINKAITLDPKFALAWDLKAMAHIQRMIFGPANHIVEERDSVMKAVERAISLEPNLGSGFIKLGWLKHSTGKWVDAESYYRKALKLLNESLSSDDDYVIAFYNAVGNFKRARELINQMRRNDPLGKGYPGHYMFNLIYFGDYQGAENEYQRCKITFGDNSWHDEAITLSRIGAGNLLSHEKIVSSDPIDILAKEYLDLPKEGLIKLRQLYTNNNNLNASSLETLSLWAAYFGDPEFAMQAMEKGIRMESSGIFFAWFPVMHEVRQTRRFKKFVKDIGLVDYWDKYGWPDICHQLDNGDFVCD